MKTFLGLTLCFTAVFAAPAPQKLSIGPPSTAWNWQASVLEDFEANFRRMREEFDQLEKSFESGFRFPNIEETGVQILENGTNIFNLDPSKVKNESFSDTKIVDGKVVHTEEKVIARGNSVVHFKKVEITPKDTPALPSDGRPKIPSKTPTVSPVPELTTSKNEIDSEHVDQDADEKSNRPRDVEEIDSVSAAGASVLSTSQSRHPQKQIYLI